ncbi:hypothetical protein AURDEDRAFT_175200 [Auricularia subglabra TFB-10046 SS5]|nr:hypothetical protein AURDEDRAFT_175200 [Auricularia subglabra TFB-10046 SS5]
MSSADDTSVQQKRQTRFKKLSHLSQPVLDITPLMLNILRLLDTILLRNPKADALISLDDIVRLVTGVVNLLQAPAGYGSYVAMVPSESGEGLTALPNAGPDADDGCASSEELLYTSSNTGAEDKLRARLQQYTSQDSPALTQEILQLCSPARDVDQDELSEQPA